MRAGGCTVQQGLTAEAASVVKQAVSLARRRGHAQVTPLHVANTMLAATSGLLRTACLQSHSHPLQCKALELCFNVALNRLPASTSASPMLSSSSSSSSHPSISNALVAAFKRAQAHQRRGSIDSQQQPLLAVKIELEQLIISILDDPSVSRVMREAGFSSTQVKTNVEQAVSVDVSSQTAAPSVTSKESNLSVLSSHQLPSDNSLPIRTQDVQCVIDSLLLNKKRKSIVIVGECVASIEGVIKGLKDRVDRDDVPEALREVNFIPISLSAFGHQSRAQVEQKLGELKTHLRSCVGKGVILYVGDLKWTSEYRACTSEQGGRGGYSSYCAVEHMIVEVGKLVSGIGENAKFWVMGIATFQTYMRCKSGHPSLETVWGIHPITIPAGSLSLSLVTHSDPKNDSTTKTDQNGTTTTTTTNSLSVEGGGDYKQQLTCCAECSAKFEIEARNCYQSTACNSDCTTTSTLPAWLRRCKNDNNLSPTNHQHNYVPVSELCKKWNSICNSTHQHPNCWEKTVTFSSVSPSSSASGFSYEQQNPKQSWGSEHHFRMYIPEHKDQNNQLLIVPNPNSTPTSSDAMETEYSHRFKELNAENLKTLCTALESKVPWQKHIIPDIATTVLKCRSGMVRRKQRFETTHNVIDVKEETWLFFQGVDVESKEKIAKELAKLVFGSQNDFVSIALSSFSSTRADSTENNKRWRDEQSCSYIERFADAASRNPHRVFFVEDVEQADYCSQMGFKRAIERGKVTDSAGEEASLADAIVILSCESFSSRSRACSPPVQQAQEGVVALEETVSPCVSLDLNIFFEDGDGDGHDDDVNQEHQSIDDIGLLESVDKRIVFKFQEL